MALDEGGAPFLGVMEVPVELDLGPFDRAAKGDLRARAERAATEAGLVASRSLSQALASTPAAQSVTQVFARVGKTWKAQTAAAGAQAGAALGAGVAAGANDGAEAATTALRTAGEKIKDALADAGKQAGDKLADGVREGVEKAREHTEGLGGPAAPGSAPTQPVGGAPRAPRGPAAPREPVPGEGGAPARAARSGDEVAKRYADAQRRRLDAEVGKIKTAAEGGLLKPHEAAARGRAAAERYNEAMRAGLLRMQREGRATRGAEAILGNTRVDVGAIANEAEEAARRTDSAFSKMSGAARRWLVGGMLAAVGAVVLGFQRGVTALIGTLTAAEERIRSTVRLAGTARLIGVPLRDLANLSRYAREELKLATTEANNIAIAAGTMAAKAGQAARAQDLLARSLDLGAAKGMKATEVAEALTNALRGEDEGLNRLGLSNPSGIYERWANAAGTTAAKLTETQRAQALLSAIVEEGSRVQGEYGRQLETDAGRMDALRTRKGELRAEIGERLLPISVKLAEAWERTMSPAVEILIGLLEKLAGRAATARQRLEEMGATAQQALPLLLAEEIGQGKSDVRRLEMQIAQARMRGNGGRGGQYGPAGTYDARDVTQVQAELREVERRIREAAAKGETDPEANARVLYLRRIIDLEGQRAQKVTDVANAENSLTTARKAAERMNRISDLEDEIEALEQQTESAALLATIELKRQQLAKLKAAEETEVVTPRAPDRPPRDKEAERKAAQELKRDLKELEQARARHATTVDKEIAQLREWADIADKRGESGLAATLRAEAEALRIYGTTAGEWADKLVAATSAGTVNGRLADGMRISNPFAAVLKQAAPALAELERQFETTSSMIAEDFARGIISEDGVRDRGADAARAFNEGLLALIDKLEADKIVPDQVVRELRNRLKIGVEAKPREIHAATNELLRFARALRGIVGDVGNLGEAAERALDTIIGIAEGVSGMMSGAEKLSKAGGALQKASAKGDILMAAFSVGTSIGNALRPIFGKMTAEQQQFHQENRAAMRDFVGALEALTDRILSDVSTTDAQQDQQEGARAATALAAHRYTREESRVRRLEALRGAAVTMGLADRTTDKLQAVDALKRWAEELDARWGTTLASFIQNADPAGLLDALRKLPEAIRTEIGQFGQFGDDAAGIIAKVGFEMDALGQTDAVERIRAVVRALQAAGKDLGEFGDELAELAGLDLATEAGRNRLDEILRGMVARMQAGTTTDPVNFGDLTPEQLRELILEFRGAAKDGGDRTSETQGYQVTRSITATQGNLLIALISTIAYLLRRVAEVVTGEKIDARGTGAIPGEGPAAPPPAVPPAPPAPPPATPPPTSPPGGGGGAGGGERGRPVEPPVRVDVQVTPLPSEIGRVAVGALDVGTLVVPDLARILAELAVTLRLPPVSLPPPEVAAPVSPISRVPPVHLHLATGAIQPHIHAAPGMSEDNLVALAVARVAAEVPDMVLAQVPEIDSAIHARQVQSEKALGYRR